MNKKLTCVEFIRLFNRFYTIKLKLLTDRYLKSDYSALESRILFEILDSPQCNANFICEKLQIDKGYLSRILKHFEKNALIKKIPSKKDGRFFNICLTQKGIKLTKTLINKSNIDIGELIKDLSEKDCESLMLAMKTIIEIMEEDNEKCG